MSLRSLVKVLFCKSTATQMVPKGFLYRCLSLIPTSKQRYIGSFLTLRSLFDYFHTASSSDHDGLCDAESSL